MDSFFVFCGDTHISPRRHLGAVSLEHELTLQSMSSLSRAWGHPLENELIAGKEGEATEGTNAQEPKDDMIF